MAKIPEETVDYQLAMTKVSVGVIFSFSFLVCSLTDPFMCFKLDLPTYS